MSNNITEGQKVAVGIIIMLVGLIVVYLLWALGILILAWAFNFEYMWTYPIGGMVISLIINSIIKR